MLDNYLAGAAPARRSPGNEIALPGPATRVGITAGDFRRQLHPDASSCRGLAWRPRSKSLSAGRDGQSSLEGRRTGVAGSAAFVPVSSVSSKQMRTAPRQMPESEGCDPNLEETLIRRLSGPKRCQWGGYGPCSSRSNSTPRPDATRFTKLKYAMIAAASWIA